MDSALGPCPQLPRPSKSAAFPRTPSSLPRTVCGLIQSWQVDRPSLIVFLDMREAFYRVYRGLLSSAPPTDEGLASVFQKLGLPPEAFHEFCATVSEQNVLATVGASARAVVSETMTSTWFRVPQQADVVRTSLGVRPGDTLADCLFFFVFARVLRDTREQLQSAGLDSRIPWCDEMLRSVHPCTTAATSGLCICDSVWMDDLALLQPVPQTSLVLSHLSLAAGTLIDCCLKRGLHPSLDRNKTEALLNVKGAGSRLSGITSVCRNLLPQLPPRFGVLRAFGLFHDIGTWGDCCIILRSSLTRSRPVWRRRGVLTWRGSGTFSQKSVPLQDKMLLFRSLVGTVLFFGAGTWPVIREKDLRRLQTGYVGLCKALLRPHFRGDVNHLTEDRILALAGAPSVSSCLHFERLTYLRSFYELGVKIGRLPGSLGACNSCNSPALGKGGCADRWSRPHAKSS